MMSWCDCSWCWESLVSMKDSEVRLWSVQEYSNCQTDFRSSVAVLWLLRGPSNSAWSYRHADPKKKQLKNLFFRCNTETYQFRSLVCPFDQHSRAGVRWMNADGRWIQRNRFLSSPIRCSRYFWTHNRRGILYDLCIRRQTYPPKYRIGITKNTPKCLQRTFFLVFLIKKVTCYPPEQH